MRSFAFIPLAAILIPVAAITWSVSVASAQAVPQCPESVPPVMRFTSVEGGEPATQVAIGRRAGFALEDLTPVGDWRNYDGRATVTFVVDDKTVFTEQISTMFEAVWIRFDHGNKAGFLAASWDQMTDASGSDRCTKTIIHAVTPVLGEPASSARASAELLTRERRWRGVRQPRNYAVWEEWLEFDIQPSHPLQLAASGPVRIRVRGAGRTYKLDLRDQWADRDPRFVPPSSLRGKHKFRFVVTSAGRVLNRGRFNVEYERAFGKRIWEGTDAFWNVCINSNRFIRSRNGRLYCWEFRYPATQAIKGLRQNPR